MIEFLFEFALYTSAVFGRFVGVRRIAQEAIPEVLDVFVESVNKSTIATVFGI